ncbi:MAG: hypothetical protein HND47_03745 [Chloroflexi bacterium]|nr:hypothetical protein [Chloroflexota bacterium]
MQKRFVLIVISLLALVFAAFFLGNGKGTSPAVQPTMEVALPTQTVAPAHAPTIIPIEDSPLKKALIAAGDYLVRQQLANGELAYQVNVLTDDRSSTPSYIRLVGGTRLAVHRLPRLRRPFILRGGRPRAGALSHHAINRPGALQRCLFVYQRDLSVGRGGGGD